jgi:Domain of unknown function (DUF6089)
MNAKFSFNRVTCNRVAVLPIALLLLLAVCGADAQGQTKRASGRPATWSLRSKFNNRYNQIGISLNSLNYMGDLSPGARKLSTDIRGSKMGIGLSYFRKMGPRYFIGFQYLHGTLSGTDERSTDIFRQQRNLSFRNRINEITAVAIFDLFRNFKGDRYRLAWTPYAFIGAGVLVHNPQALAPSRFLDGSVNPDAGKWVDLQPLGTEGQYADLQKSDINYGVKPYSLVQFVVPLGVGVRWKLNEQFDLWFDVGMRVTSTDYLDDVSGNYVDLNRLKAKNSSDTRLGQALSYRSNEIEKVVPNPSDPYQLQDGQVDLIAGYGSEHPSNKRGNSTQNDSYFVTSFKLTYLLTSTGRYRKAKFR